MKPHSWVPLAFALVLSFLAGPLAARTVQAGGGPGGAAPPPARWEQLASTGGARLTFGQRALLPSDGGLVFKTDEGVIRSLDGGHTWQPLTLPPGAVTGNLSPSRFAVHPAGADVLYVSSGDTLFKTADGGATWQEVLSGSVAAAGRDGAFAVLGVVVSPANGDVLHAYRTSNTLSMGGIVYSTDGGVTWTQPPPRAPNTGSGGSTCLGSSASLYPHSRDPGRVFYSISICPAGRDIVAGWGLGSSAEYGAAGRSAWFPARPSLDPRAVTGGFESAPARFYLAAIVPGGSRGALFRTDDDGSAWRELLPFPSEPASRQPYMFTVTAIPADPNRVYVGAQFRAAPVGQRRGVVRASSDGGATWRDVGDPLMDIGEVSHLALSPDGSWLYAATSTGLWRIAI